MLPTISPVLLSNNTAALLLFFSHKLTGAQRNYTTIHKVLLSVVKTLTTFWPILLGSKIHVWTDHANLTFTQLLSQQVLCWRIFIEEYGPKFHWKKGIENIEADTLSRYPRLGGEHTMDESLFYNDLFLKESFLNYPDNVDNFPLNFLDIAAAQVTDPTVQNYAAPTQGFVYQDYHGIQLLCRQSTDGQWKIVIPEALINDTICWYHAIMGHVGSSRLYDSLRFLVWFSGM
jgi:hypothetical protein